MMTEEQRGEGGLALGRCGCGMKWTRTTRESHAMTERKQRWWRVCWALGSLLRTCQHQTTKVGPGTHARTEGTVVDVVGTGGLVGVGACWPGGCKSVVERTRTLHWRGLGPEDERPIGRWEATKTGTHPLFLAALDQSMLLRDCTRGVAGVGAVAAAVGAGGGEVGSDPVFDSGPGSQRKEGKADEKARDCGLEERRDGLVVGRTSAWGTAVRGARLSCLAKEAATSKRGGGRERLEAFGR